MRCLGLQTATGGRQIQFVPSDRWMLRVMEGGVMNLIGIVLLLTITSSFSYGVHMK